MLYGALHLAGVIHSDVTWRHVLRRGNSLRIIDFERALTRLGHQDDRTWRERCEMEMSAVEIMLSDPVY